MANPIESGQIGGGSSSSDLVTGGLNVGNNLVNYFLQRSLNRQMVNNQKELFDYQSAYNAPVHEAQRLRAAGLTEAAIAQKLAGSNGSQSMPVASFSPSPSLGTNLGESLADTKLKTSETLERQEATENLRQQRFWNSRRWFQEINESISRTVNNYSQSAKNDAERYYFYEFGKTLEAKRPWELNNMRVGLLKLIQDIEESKSRQYLNYQKGQTEPYIRQNLSSQTELNYSEKFNADQHGFALMWDNDLRAGGFNPSQNYWQNLFRIASTNPKKVINILDNYRSLLNELDNKAKSQFGPHYKNKLLIGAGLYYGGKLFNKHVDRNIYRLNGITGAVGNLLPTLVPSAPSPNYYDGWNSSYSY